MSLVYIANNNPGTYRNGSIIHLAALTEIPRSRILKHKRIQCGRHILTLKMVNSLRYAMVSRIGKPNHHRNRGEAL